VGYWGGKSFASSKYTPEGDKFFTRLRGLATALGTVPQTDARGLEARDSPIDARGWSLYDPWESTVRVILKKLNDFKLNIVQRNRHTKIEQNEPEYKVPDTVARHSQRGHSDKAALFILFFSFVDGARCE
jgi:hypothetical protein